MLPGLGPAWLWFRLLKLRNELVLPGLQAVKQKKKESAQPGLTPHPGKASAAPDLQVIAQTGGISAGSGTAVLATAPERLHEL